MYAKQIPIYFLLILFVASCNNESTPIVEDQDTVEVIDSIVTPTPSIKTDVVEIDPEELVDNKDVSKLNEAQKSVQLLLEYCSKKQNNKAADLMAYMGADNERNLSGKYNYTNEDEKKMVNTISGLLLAWLNESESYEFISYEEKVTDEGMPIKLVEVMFNKQEIGINRRFFSLIDTKDGLLVADIY